MTAPESVVRAVAVRWWWPRLERLDGKAQAWVEARRRARPDFLVRDRIRSREEDR